jgi:4-alpha-glucanotransferase
MSAPPNEQASEQAIHALADAAGVARNWTDAAGEAKTVATHNLRAILTALGLPCATDAQCHESHQRLHAHHNGRLPPLVTATRGQAVFLPLPEACAGQACHIDLEEGGQVDTYLARDDQGRIHLPAIDACGYHRLQTGELSCTLAVAPPRCFGVDDALHTGPGQDAPVAPRCWGVGVQLYSLRRPGDAGIGDFTALKTLVQGAAGVGAATVAISPVHAMFSADTERFSPYGPSSRLFLNALHVDPAAVAGPQAMAAALASLDDGAHQTIARVEQEDFVDWPAAGKLRLKLLRILFEQMHAQSDGPFADPAAQAEFADFRRLGGQALEDHARFEMLHAQRLAAGESGDWRTWPEGLRNPRNSEVAALAQVHRTAVDFHAFLQWQAARGLAGAQACARSAGMPIGLIADLAIGADRAGSQAWSLQGEMINGLSVGAPPDVINARGQDWGLGAFSPHAMQAQGFAAYIQMLRAVFAYCGGVRIDHVLGLARLWLVPDGATSADGAYLRYPMDDLLRLIALESHRHRAIVIGEDLGTVPAGFDARLAQAGLLGIRVLYFETGHDGFKPPWNWSDSAIATTTTHDLPTVAGWWAGRDIDWRARLDLLAVTQSQQQAQEERAQERGRLWHALCRDGVASGDMPAPDAPDTVVDAALAYVTATPAPLVVIPIEDLLGVVEQPNLPGTVDTHPNWRRRLSCDTAAMFDSPAVRQRVALLNRSRSILLPHP